jgi:hypothetical protein
VNRTLIVIAVLVLSVPHMAVVTLGDDGRGGFGPRTWAEVLAADPRSAPLDTTADLHTALHQAISMSSATIDGADHAKMDRVAAALPPALARDLGALLSARNTCAALVQLGRSAATQLACAAALGELAEQRAGALEEAGASLETEGCAPIMIGTAAFQILVGGPDATCYGNAGVIPSILIVDVGGDDTYPGHVGAGSGVALALDVGGSDIYTGAQGVGLRGIGLLLDLGSGSDVYATLWTHAAAQDGVGVILDGGGDDTYLCALTCQGFGIGGGLGVGQGFGTGVLWDRAGNDVYRTWDWLGPGIWMGQGAGIQGGFGLLLDEQGDDTYAALGRSQGYSRGERSSGLLFDLDGNDRYAMQDASGRGVAEDRAERAIFVDAGGVDAYEGPAPGRNNAIWFDPTFGRGIGMDCEPSLVLHCVGFDVLAETVKYPAIGPAPERQL